jgi:hypothetical protein
MIDRDTDDCPQRHTDENLPVKFQFQQSVPRGCVR